MDISVYDFIGSYNETTGDCYDCLLPENVDPILQKYQSQIKSFGYMTVYLDQLEYNPLDMWNIKQIWDMSTIYKSDDYWTNVIGFSPGQIFEEIFDVKYRDK